MLNTWKSITLWKRVLIGLVIGLVAGLGVRYGFGAESATEIANTWFKPFGDAFVRLIKMLVIPLVFTTLISGVTAMGDPKKLGSLGAKTIGLYLLTTLFAVTLGLVVGTIVKPGAGVDYGNGKANVTESPDADLAQQTEPEQGSMQQAGVSQIADSKKQVQDKLKAAEESGSFVDRLLKIIPTNPAEALATGDVLGAIFFAVMVGIGILNMGPRADPVKNFFDAAAEVVMAITLIVMEVAPFGVMALMAWVMGTQGIGVLESLGKLAFSLYLACFIQITCVYGGLIVKGLLRLPLIQFFRGIADAQGVAFSTASSSGTLPVTINCAEKNLGVNKSVASSVLPLGATINMDGTAIYLGLIALFAAQSTGVELSLSQYFMVALTATLVSVGAAGIPSAGLLLAATVLDVIGIKESDAVLVIAFIYPFDRLLDMMRTVTNVTGDVAVACTVAKSEGALDEELFRAPPVTKA